MNVTNSDSIQYFNFNQDFSCLSVGTNTGFRVYNCDPFGKCYQRTDGAGGGSQPAFSPRRLQITNTKRQSTICELNFVTSILAVKLNRKRLVVVLDTQIHIYDISNMKILHTIDTRPNPAALVALSSYSDGDSCYLAYPAHGSTFNSSNNNNNNNNTGSGEVLIFDTLTLRTVNIIAAHKSPLSHLAFNADGTMLATASDKGTVVRVFSVPAGKRLYQFRRGSTAANVQSITFNQQSNMICVCSDSDTIHIFKLQHQQQSLILAATSLLPESMAERWEPVRDFAYLKLPKTSLQSICALMSHTNTVVVVSSDGYMREYGVDLVNGGECVFLKQYSILDSSDSLSLNDSSAHQISVSGGTSSSSNAQ